MLIALVPGVLTGILAFFDMGRTALNVDGSKRP
jgi:L-cystine uptake protein TcyP (sodium:dicarboxylate symporter family)